MDEKSFNDMAIRAAIVPQQDSWPDPYPHAHWRHLHDCANTARVIVSKTFSEMTRVGDDKTLSAEGKRQRRNEIAQKAVAEIEESKALLKAREAVDAAQAKWAKKFAETIKAAETLHDTTVAAQIRDRVASQRPEKRMEYIAQHVNDAASIAALLTAPAYLSELSPAEHALVMQRAEQLAFSPEDIADKEATEKALAAAERGWRTAVGKIGERAAMTRNSDGTSSATDSRRAADTTSQAIAAATAAAKARAALGG